MTRDMTASINYWNHFTGIDVRWIKESNAALSLPTINQYYDLEFTLDSSRRPLCLALRRYSRGDNVDCIGGHVAEAIGMRGKSNELSRNLFRTRH